MKLKELDLRKLTLTALDLNMAVQHAYHCDPDHRNPYPKGSDLHRQFQSRYEQYEWHMDNETSGEWR